MFIDVSAFPKNYVDWQLCSPVIHEGLAYLVNNAAVMTVVDVEAGTIVYQKMLDLDIFQAVNEGAARGIGISPILAGKHLYFLGNSGATLVIEPPGLPRGGEEQDRQCCDGRPLVRAPGALRRQSRSRRHPPVHSGRRVPLCDRTIVSLRIYEW